MAKSKAQKTAERRIKKWLRSLPMLTKVLAVTALILGIACGAIFCTLAFRNDDFYLNGTKQISLTVSDESYLYTEEGVTAICFGRDVSGTLKIECSEGIIDHGNGTYTIPTDKAGIYTITYTFDCYKLGEDREDGQPIKRIRVFTVDEVEEDGKNNGLEEGNA